MHKTRHLNGDRISVQLAVLMGKAGYLALQKEPAGCLPRPAPITAEFSSESRPKSPSASILLKGGIASCVKPRWQALLVWHLLHFPAARRAQPTLGHAHLQCIPPSLTWPMSYHRRSPHQKGSAGARCPQGP